MHLDTIKVFYLPTDAQQNCFPLLLSTYNQEVLTFQQQKL
jgi:hypothetical protein